MGYHWFDVPAYEDFDRKLWMAVKYSSIAGFAAGTYHNFLFAVPRTALEVAVPVVRSTGFFVGTAIAGTVGIWGSAKFREKDDIWNYIIGGLSTSAFWALRARNFAHFVNLGFLTVPTFMFIKATHSREDNGETLFGYAYPRPFYGGTAWGFQDRAGIDRGRDPGILDRSSKF